MALPPQPTISIAVSANTPILSDEGKTHHLHVSWVGIPAVFIFAALRKYGGTTGEFLTDAIRFYYWYMNATDTHQLFVVPHSEAWKVKESIEQAHGSPVELLAQ